MSVDFKLPWYNRNGWLDVKHRLTYLCGLSNWAHCLLNYPMPVHTMQSLILVTFIPLKTAELKFVPRPDDLVVFGHYIQFLCKSVNAYDYKIFFFDYHPKLALKWWNKEKLGTVWGSHHRHRQIVNSGRIHHCWCFHGGWRTQLWWLWFCYACLDCQRLSCCYCCSLLLLRWLYLLWLLLLNRLCHHCCGYTLQNRNCSCSMLQTINVPTIMYW